MRPNLYRIDDLLLRSGGLLAIGGVVALFNWVPEQPAITAMAIAVLAVSCPLSLITAGWWLRRRERRVLVLWRMLREHGSVRIGDALQLTGLKRGDLRRAVRQLGQAGLGCYLVDFERGVVGPPQAEEPTLSHSQRCGSCGAQVSVRVTKSVDVYSCSYCNAPLQSAQINLLRAQLDPQPTLAGPTGGQADVPSAADNRRGFSLAVFALLIVFFWPAAVWYAVARSRRLPLARREL